MNLGKLNTAAVEANAGNTFPLAPTPAPIKLSKPPHLPNGRTNCVGFRVDDSPTILKYIATCWQISVQASNRR